jgi:hypothetical protein
MLRIYPVVLEVLKRLQPTLKRIEVKDRDLARQRRRCSSSIALNLAEVAPGESLGGGSMN